MIDYFHYVVLNILILLLAYLLNSLARVSRRVDKSYFINILNYLFKDL